MSHCHSESPKQTDNHVHSGSHCHPKNKKDWLLISSSIVIILSFFIHYINFKNVIPNFVSSFSHSIVELMFIMSWGIILGIIIIGFLSFVPREVVISIIGSPDSKRGILKATLAGLLLDLCSHGILMVGIKLYERGASLAQVMAFLIASPWNSLSLTLILFALVGIPYTFAFIVLSAVIAIVTGLIVKTLLAKKLLPENPNKTTLPTDFKTLPALKVAFSGKFQDVAFYFSVLKNGILESRMVVRWIFFGTVLTAFVRLLLTTEQYTTYLGPTLAGLGLTFFVATILEVCSEGSTPLAADLVIRAKAPGNAFAFLMTGVSTDYTEIMSLKEATHSWKASLILPLLTVPQVLAIAYLINIYR